MEDMRLNELNEHDEPLDSSYFFKIELWSGWAGGSIEKKYVYEDGRFVIIAQKGFNNKQLMVFRKKGQLSKVRMDKLKSFIDKQLSLIGSSSTDTIDMSCGISYIFNGKQYAITGDFDTYEKADKILSLKVEFTQSRKEYEEDQWRSKYPEVLDDKK